MGLEVGRGALRGQKPQSQLPDMGARTLKVLGEEKEFLPTVPSLQPLLLKYLKAVTKNKAKSKQN